MVSAHQELSCGVWAGEDHAWVDRRAVLVAQLASDAEDKVGAAGCGGHDYWPGIDTSSHAAITFCFGRGGVMS